MCIYTTRLWQNERSWYVRTHSFLIPFFIFFSIFLPISLSLFLPSPVFFLSRCRTILLSFSFAFVYLGNLLSFFFPFFFNFFFPAFFLPQTFLAFRYTANKNEACVCIYMCAYTTRIWYHVWYTISTFVACLCYFSFFFFFFSRLFSFLRFLFLPHGGFHFPFCFSFLHSINFVRIGFFLWRPSNFESMIAIFIVFFVYLFSISLKSNENTYMEIIDGNRNEWSNRKLVLKYFADSDYY